MEYLGLLKNIFFTNIRLSSLIGKNFEQRITNKLVKQVAEGENITISGINQKFSFLDVRDAAAALISMLNLSPAKWKKRYNLGSNKSYTLLELTQKILLIGSEKFNLNVKLNIIENDLWKNSEMDCSCFYKDFNWIPHYTIYDTIIDLYKEQLSRPRA